MYIQDWRGCQYYHVRSCEKWACCLDETKKQQSQKLSVVAATATSRCQAKRREQYTQRLAAVADMTRSRCSAETEPNTTCQLETKEKCQYRQAANAAGTMAAYESENKDK